MEQTTTNDSFSAFDIVKSLIFRLIVILILYFVYSQPIFL